MSTSVDVNDIELIQLAAGTCSLDSSPGKNWVEKSGGLPNYICKIAKAIMRSGKSKSAAIAIAVSRVKRWASGGDDVNADTRAKAAAALAQWEALKAKNKAREVVASAYADGTPYLMLSYEVKGGPFKVDFVRTKFFEEFGYEYYIEEMWSDHLIVDVSDTNSEEFFRVDYSANDYDVTFGRLVPMKRIYIEEPDFTDEELELLADYMED